MITAHGNEKIAVEAMKLGAEDYVPKPFDNDEIRLVVRRALERTALARENRMLRARLERELGFENLIGSGPAMRRVFATIQKVAETDLTVLIRGESGTGKELVAQALHQHSARQAGALRRGELRRDRRELVESELFGHEKGAFTGAEARRVGRFEAADGGTIFLDEIGDMPPETQAKLLRVLAGAHVRARRRQQAARGRRARRRRDPPRPRARGARRAASARTSTTGCAWSSSSCRRCASGARTCPPLGGALPRAARRAPRARAPPPLGAAPSRALSRHAWPGNVRELRNVVERAAVLAPGEEIEAEDLALRPRRASAADGRRRRELGEPPLRRGQAQRRRIASSAPSCCARCARTAATCRAPPRRSAWCARACSRRSASSGSATRTGARSPRAEGGHHEHPTSRPAGPPRGPDARHSSPAGCATARRATRARSTRTPSRSASPSTAS